MGQPKYCEIKSLGYSWKLWLQSQSWNLSNSQKFTETKPQNKKKVKWHQPPLVFVEDTSERVVLQTNTFSSNPPKVGFTKQGKQTHGKQAKTPYKRGKERKIHTAAMEKLKSNISRGGQEAQDSRQKCISKTTADRLPDISDYTEKPRKCQSFKE